MLSLYHAIPPLYRVLNDMYTFMPAIRRLLASKLRKNEWKQHYTSLIKYADTRYQSQRRFIPRRSGKDEPYREQCDREEVVE